MKYKIEKNIPIPPRRKDRNEAYKIIDKMEVGDSVLVKKEMVQKFRSAFTHRNISYKSINMHNGTYRIWKLIDNKNQ